MQESFSFVEKPPRTQEVTAGGESGQVADEWHPDATGDLGDLKAQAMDCHRCKLRDTCTGVVFGEGDPDTDILLIGEAPGRDEDLTGRPFVGRAGKLLDKILDAIGLGRDDVYITNVNKCRPPGNRLPTPDEERACRPWLDAQIRIIKPSVIICLGSHAARAIIDRKLKITKERGKWVKRDGIWIMPTFHPAALLRDTRKKRPVWEDFKKVRDYCRNLNR